jgi:hypothetical protein
MNIQVRYFCLQLSLLIQQRCLQGESFGTFGNEMAEHTRKISSRITGLKQFQNKQALSVLLDSRDMLITMAEKLASGDWTQLSTVINLLHEVTAGNVLIVEKEQYDQLNAQYENEVSNIPQM